MDGLADSVKLLHQRLVDMQAAGGIQNHHIALMLTGVFDRLQRGLDRILRCLLYTSPSSLPLALSVVATLVCPFRSFCSILS